MKRIDGKKFRPELKAAQEKTLEPRTAALLLLTLQQEHKESRMVLKMQKKKSMSTCENK